MPAKRRFEKLLEPLSIGGVRLKNRMVRPPQGLCLVDMDGSINEKTKLYYEAIARGGVGLVVAGAAPVVFPLGFARSNIMAAYDDKFIPGLNELVRVIHKYDCPTFLQIHHMGPALIPGNFNGIQPVSASPLREEEKIVPTFAEPRGLTTGEVEAVISHFVQGAERAMKAGFDGTEIHAAHPYLLNSFLSRAWNRRDDVYGPQSLESRAKIVVDIIRGIKKRMGQDFPVGVRFNGMEWGVKDGITSEESRELGRIFQEAGVDYLHVSGYGVGLYNDVRIPETILFPEPLPEAKLLKKPGLLVPLAEAVKKKVSIPVVTVGGIDPALGEWILRQGMADLIAFARRLLADPDLPNKVAAGKLEEIRPCMACLECLHSIRRGEPVRCRVNGALGKEFEYEIKPAQKKKRVMIIGAGPAGMEAARVTAMRGHDVSLYDKDNKLGGLLNVAAVIKGTEIERLPDFIRYFRTQLSKLGVKLRLAKEVNASLILEVKPDVVILTTGGIPAQLERLGANSPIVIKTAKLHQRVRSYLRFLSPNLLRWLTRFYLPVGKRVVILGGKIQGCELAKFLVKRNRKVTILETTHQLGEGMADQYMERLRPWFDKKGVTLLTEVQFDKISDTGITIITKEGKKTFIEADTILPAFEAMPNHQLFQALEGKVPEIYLLGDCRKPRRIVDAISDAWLVGRGL